MARWTAARVRTIPAARRPLPPPRAEDRHDRQQKVITGLALAVVAIGGGADGALVANGMNDGQTVISSPRS